LHLISKKGNIQMAFYGDLMMIRAICDLKKGDEVTVHYQPPLHTYEQRSAVLESKWGFLCDCRLCELDRQECPNIATERNQLVKAYKEEFK
jgi:SET domain-containing protein